MKYWKSSDYLLVVSQNRSGLQRLFFAFALLGLLLNFLLGLAISQIGPNPLLNQDIDPVYLLLMRAGVPQLIASAGAPYFDAILLLSCIACLIWTRYTVFPAVFCILYFLYFTTYNFLSGHHYTNIGILILSFAFAFVRPKQFAFAFSGCRFLFCFMMFSAACWKLIRGNLLQPDQANMLLITTHLDRLVADAPSLFTAALKWLIGHRYVAHSIWVILIMIEGLFVVGFFTYKYDNVLLVLYLLFFTGGWLIFDIYNYENLAFLFTLKPIIKLITKHAIVTEPPRHAVAVQ